MGDASVLLYQAIGMTMEHLDCSGKEAFAALLAMAGRTGRAPSELAEDVVERRIRFGSARGRVAAVSFVS